MSAVFRLVWFCYFFSLLHIRGVVFWYQIIFRPTGKTCEWAEFLFSDLRPFIFPIQSDVLALHLTGFPQTQRLPLHQWEAGCLRVKWKKAAVDLLLEIGMELFNWRVLENDISPSATIMKRFVKRSLTKIFCQTNFLTRYRYFRDPPPCPCPSPSAA